MLGHYRLVEKIGVGGMGEVWRAVDTTLGREVAIKILPAAFTAEAERLARFEREAKLLASLNHPNIATIHGLHEVDGVRFLAMELVAGEDLAERLKSGALPLAEALDVARQIAEALEAAHEQGVIHRDLKPANVRRTPDGRVKVLDFGLAKSVDVAPASAPRDAAMSPTITSLGTVAGVILGTAAYMSPEQARGKPVDKRADVWAFGCLLYELLGGKRPFDGETISDTLAAVLAKDPDWGALPPSLPPRIRELLVRCLEKDPKRRLRDIGEARIELENALANRTASGSIPAVAAPAVAAAPRPLWRSPAVIVAASLFVAAAALAARAVTASKGAGAGNGLVVRATLSVPKGLALPFDDRNLAVSPDGTQVVVSLMPTRSLYLRDLSRLEFRQLAGTDGASYPFWSPDGKSIAFFSERELKRIDLADGMVRVICPAPAGRGGTWGTQDTIVLAPSAVGGLFIVDAAGGSPSPITEPASPSESQRVPGMLPDGRRFLYYAMNTAKPGVYAFDPATKTSRFVVASEAEAVFVEPASLVFARDENLVVQPFDLDRLELTGSPKPIAAGVYWDLNRVALGMSLSSRGTLVYQTVVHAGTGRLAWMDRNGARTPIPVEPFALAGGSLSSDGRRAAVNVAGDRGDYRLAAIDLERGIKTSIGDANAKHYFGALLSRDGQRVLTSNNSADAERVVAFPFGGGPETRLLDNDPGFERSPMSITPDGRTLLFERRSLVDKVNDIMTLDLDGQHAPKAFMTTPENEVGPSVSPSGDLVVYSLESRGSVLNVVTYPTPSTPVQVSPAAVSTFGWLSANEVFWIDASAKVWSAVITSKNGQLDVGAPKALFGGRPLDRNVAILAYDIPRGRFFIALEETKREEPQLILVSDWRQNAAAPSAGK